MALFFLNKIVVCILVYKNNTSIMYVRIIVELYSYGGMFRGIFTPRKGCGAYYT